MSVATEFVPDVYIPERARTSGRSGALSAPERLASVTTLHRPSERTIAPAVRLTRRGVVVLAAAVSALAAALIALAWASAPASGAGSVGHAGAPVHASTADTVVVRPGDSLWSLAAADLGDAVTPARVAAQWPRWWQANREAIGDDPDLLRPGTPLVPPAR